MSQSAVNTSTLLAGIKIKRNIIIVALALVTATVISLIVAPLLNVEKEAEVKAQLVTGHIYDELNSSLSRPISITRTMASDQLLVNALKNERSVQKQEMEALMSSYLTGLKDTFDYIVAFVVSDGTRRYYTSDGIANIVDPENHPYDIWYQQFLDSNKSINLDPDRDQINGYRWTIFINARVTDADGTLLGVCGVGLFMDDIQDIIEHEEKAHALKISFIDKDGLVQVDTDSSNIENAYISDAIADNAGSSAFTYKVRSSGGWRMVRYMPELEWFLVIQQFARTETKSYLVHIIALYVLTALLLIAGLRGKNAPALHDLRKGDVTKDLLTGLPNRNYVRDHFGEQGIFNTTRYKTIAMFDIDSFKNINETRDGDAIILGLVQEATGILGERGMLFRWAGDEFVCFLEMEGEQAEVAFKTLCACVKEHYDVTISCGIMDVDLTESIKTNYHRAVQQCYAVKEHGGNGVQRKA